LTLHIFINSYHVAWLNKECHGANITSVGGASVTLPTKRKKAAEVVDV